MDQEIAFGNFIAREHLKTDGVIEIYAGTAVRGEQRVLIKSLPADYAGNPDVVTRFYWEATVSEHLKGLPGVVPLLERGTTADGAPYYVLPIYEATLASVVQKADRFPLQDRLSIARDVLEGLASCHGRDVVHRNLTPGAIVLDTKSRKALLTEFGMARLGEQDPFGAKERTFDDAQYSSPEQSEMKPVDRRSDVYAVGAVLFELLGGRKPFSGDSTEAIQVSKLEKGPPSLRQLNPQVPAEVEAVIARALVQDPAGRWPSGREMLAALQGATSPQGAAPGKQPPPAAKKPVVPPRRAAVPPGIDLDIDIDKDEVSRPATGSFDIGEHTDAFHRLEGKDRSHLKQTLVIVTLLVAVVAVVAVWFYRRAQVEARLAEEQRREEAARLAEEKKRQDLAEQLATIQTEGDDLQRAGKLDEAMAKHREVLARDAENAVSTRKIEELEAHKEAAKGMILVPAGRFTYGLDEEEGQLLRRKVKSKPEQIEAAPIGEEYVEAFFIDRREVTNAEYKAFLAEHPDVPAPTSSDPDDEGISWKERSFPEGKGDHPVSLVTWPEASAYCGWAAGKRLPTGIEWEKAARGEERLLWPWGNDWDKGKCNTAASQKYNPEPVGSYAEGASPYGVLDMVGNVSEWTSDEYQVDGKELAGIAGASFLDEDSVTPAALRFSQEKDTRRITTGFRCALTP